MTTRSYTLDNCDAHLSKFESHRRSQFLGADAPLPVVTPVFSASELPVVLAVQDSRNRSDHLPNDASNGGSHNSTTMRQTFQKQPLFELSDLSDSDLPDTLTDVLHISRSTTEEKPRSHSMSNKGTRRSPSSTFSLKSETFVNSPALTPETVSTHTADAHGEDLDEDVIIVQHIPASSFSSQNKSLDEAPTCAVHESLFTPPPSEAEVAASTLEFPPSNPKKNSTKTVLSHILVPPLSRPRSKYVKASSFTTLKDTRKRPRRTAQEPKAVSGNNSCLDSGLCEHDDEEGGPRKKKKRRKHKEQQGRGQPFPPLPRRSPIDEIVFVTNTPTVIRPLKEIPDAGKDTVIDLTLDDDEDAKPIPLLSEPTESTTHVPKTLSPDRELVAEETQIRIGVVYSVSYRTLLFNTRFLRCPQGNSKDPEELAMLSLPLPIRSRRALLDNDLEMSRPLGDEYSIGHPVVTEFDWKGVDDDYDGYSEDELAELLDPASESPVTTFVPDRPIAHPPASQVQEPEPPMPKIDLAAKFRKKKPTARRNASFVTPSANKAMPPTFTSVSRSLASFSQKTRDLVMDDVTYSPHTPMVPSAKALGKRKGADPAVQPMPLSISRLPVIPPEIPTTYNFEKFINYRSLSPDRPTTLTSDNHFMDGAVFGYPDLYSNPTLPSSLPNITCVDHGHHQPSAFSSIEPAVSPLYHSDNYITGTTNDFIPGFDPSASETTTIFPLWSSELETSFPYGTINPMLLGGETLGMPEPTDLSAPGVEHESLDREKEVYDGSNEMSPSRSCSASPMTLSSSPRSVPIARLRKAADSDTIHVRRRQSPTTLVNGRPRNEKQRRRVKRLMPDMVPLSELSLSSDSELGEDDEPARSIIVSKPPIRPIRSKLSKSRTKSLPTVPTAVLLPAELNMNGPQVKVGGQFWPTQDEATYCHQCRNKTAVLKLACQRCYKLYCVRCLTTRYPDEPRALRMKETGCPLCLDYCNCTGCCKRRGVTYISTKDALAGGVAMRAQLSAPTKLKLGSSSVPSSLFPSPAPYVASPSYRSLTPLYSTRPLSPAGGVYWGTIYGADGSKIGGGFTFKKQDVVMESNSASVKADTAHAPPRKKRRVYAGEIHPSWEFENAVKTAVLDPVPPAKKVHESRRPRHYVGNKAFLFYKSETMARELADLSPLSSLEEDWDEEDGRLTGGKEEYDDERDRNGENGADQDSQRDWREVSERSLTDHDVRRAITLGLDACGISFAG